jgi:hypothetical protein
VNERSADKDAGLHVTFYRSWRAFPHTRDRADDIVVSVHPNGHNRGGNYEFAIEHIGTEPRGRAIALRVQLFDDSWRAFSDLPAFFTMLASLDRSEGARPGVTLDDLTPELRALGWIDKTDGYAANHEHHFACICGERVLPPASGRTP